MVKNKVTSDDVAEILADAEIVVDKLFDNCTMVACRLSNGFVIVETSACVDPANYNEEIGYKICMDRITDKIYELEGYKLCDEFMDEERYTCDDVDEDEDEFDCENCPDLYKCMEDYDKYDGDDWFADTEDLYDYLIDAFDRFDDVMNRRNRRYRG